MQGAELEAQRQRHLQQQMDQAAADATARAERQAAVAAAKKPVGRPRKLYTLADADATPASTSSAKPADKPASGKGSRGGEGAYHDWLCRTSSTGSCTRACSCCLSALLCLNSCCNCFWQLGSGEEGDGSSSSGQQQWAAALRCS